jgi:hypothetical protein
LAPSFNSIEMGGQFQLPKVPSKSVSYLSSNESSFSWCDGVRWEQLSLFLAGKSALSYLASSISMTLLLPFRVLLVLGLDKCYVLVPWLRWVWAADWQYSSLAGGYYL